MSISDVYPYDLTIIVPCFNEAGTIGTLLMRLGSVDFGTRQVQVVVVDDGSRDGSAERVPATAGRYPITLVRQLENRGKGSAVRVGVHLAQGRYTIIQDADLEYDPAEIPRLLGAAERQHLVAVYGSRNLRRNQSASWFFYMGGLVMTVFGNLLYGTKLTDQCTCYKLVRTDVVKSLALCSPGFELDTELTLKLARLAYPITELPISYQPRTIGEGKKINLVDAIKIFFTILRYRFWQPREQRYNWLDRLIRYLRVRAAARYVQTGDRVLDVGCGSACYLHTYLGRRGISHSYLGLDRRGMEIGATQDLMLNWDASLQEPFPVPAEGFDRVFMLALLEHLTDVPSVLKQVYGALVSGGEVLITTPAPRSRLVLEALAHLGAIDHEEIDEHEHYFSPTEVRVALMAAGFAVHDVQVRRFEFGFNLLARARKT